MVLGLERAIDLIELVEEEQGRQAPPPQPGHPASGGTPQTEEDEELLADGEEGGDNLSEGHHGGASPGEEMENSQNAKPSRGAPTPEGPQAPGQPLPKKL